jgi:hypothetical protein
MNYDHNFSEQPELLAAGQRSGRTELLSRVDLKKNRVIGTCCISGAKSKSREL